MTPYTQNRYAYVGNNPVNRWDPFGYSEIDYNTPIGTTERPVERLLSSRSEVDTIYDYDKKVAGPTGWLIDYKKLLKYIKDMQSTGM